MGKYFIDNELHRVNFEDGQWVDIKDELSQRDQDYILNAMAKAKAKNNPEVELNLGRQTLLEVSVKAWSFTDDNGKPVPVSPDNLSNLRTKYRSKILAEIDRLNQESSRFLASSQMDCT